MTSDDGLAGYATTEWVQRLTRAEDDGDLHELIRLQPNIANILLGALRHERWRRLELEGRLEAFRPPVTASATDGLADSLAPSFFYSTAVTYIPLAQRPVRKGLSAMVGLSVEDSDTTLGVPAAPPSHHLSTTCDRCGEEVERNYPADHASPYRLIDWMINHRTLCKGHKEIPTP